MNQSENTDQLIKGAKSLIFVYNTSQGAFNRLSDWLHKALRPSTYPCSLCNITHGLTGPRKEWTDFLNQLPLDALFFHKDEWEKSHAEDKAELPQVLFRDAAGDKVVFDAETIASFEQLDDLMLALKEKLKSFGV